MTKPTRRPSSRDKILDAAITIVAEAGVPQLTIEAAAAAAGVTKAGLIYHFKTRDELLAAVVEAMANEIDVYSRAKDASRAAKGPRAMAPGKAQANPQSELQAALLEQVEMTFDMPEQLQRLMRSLLQAHATNPAVMPPVQALFERGYEMMAASSNPGRALLISLAMDGMQLIELLQLHEFTPAQRKIVKKAAQELIVQLS